MSSKFRSSHSHRLHTIPAKFPFPLPPNVTRGRRATLSLSLPHPNQKVLSISFKPEDPLSHANTSISFFAVSANPRSDFWNRFWSPKMWNHWLKFDPAWSNSSNLNRCQLLIQSLQNPSTISSSFSISSSTLSLLLEI